MAGSLVPYFQAQSNPRLNGRALPLNMGRVLGGGSSVNAMIWARGHKHDRDCFAAEAGKREVMPGLLKGCELENFIRDGIAQVRHQTCTAKMGRDPMSVVDGKLKVYGIETLRVACGWVYHATGNHRQHDGSLRHHWRARRRSPTGRAQAANVGPVQSPMRALRTVLSITPLTHRWARFPPPRKAMKRAGTTVLAKCQSRRHCTPLP
jgi:hypothetical protein